MCQATFNDCDTIDILELASVSKITQLNLCSSYSLVSGTAAAVICI